MREGDKGKRWREWKRGKRVKEKGIEREKEVEGVRESTCLDIQFGNYRDAHVWTLYKYY